MVEFRDGSPQRVAARRSWPTVTLVLAIASVILVGGLFLRQPVYRDRLAKPIQPGRAVKPPDASASSSSAQLLAPRPELPSGDGFGEDLPAPKTAEELLEEARRTAGRIAELFPDNPDALEVKARILFYLGDYGGAAACWRKCLRRDPSYAYAYHGLGLVAAKEADYEEAATQQRQALELAPGYCDIVVELADVLMKLDSAGEAVAVLERHIGMSPQSLDAWIQLGHAYLQEREFQKAHDAYRAALGIHAEVPAAQFGMATSLARLRKTAEAREAMEKYRELEARKIEIRTDLRHRFDDLKAMSANVAAKFALAGRVCLAHGELAEAERLFRRAATLDPANAQCRVQLASLYQQTSRSEEALRMCRQLIEIEPKNSGYHRNLGILLGNLGRLEEAERAVNEAMRLAPESRQAHAALARLYLRTGRKLDKAVELAEQAVRVQGDARSYALLSRAHAANGNLGEAVLAVKKAIEVGGDDSEYREMLRTFQQGK